MVEERKAKKKSVNVVNHAGRAPCKIDAACLPACQHADLLNYISLPRRSVYCAAAKRLCVDVSETRRSWCF